MMYGGRHSTRTSHIDQLTLDFLRHKHQRTAILSIGHEAQLNIAVKSQRPNELTPRGGGGANTHTCTCKKRDVTEVVTNT